MEPSEEIYEIIEIDDIDAFDDNMWYNEQGI